MIERNPFTVAACTKAILFQESAHFPFSIRHNVTMRFEHFPGEEERIWEALRLAGLEAVVRALPDSLETVVGAGFGGVADLENSIVTFYLNFASHLSTKWPKSPWKTPKYST